MVALHLDYWHNQIKSHFQPSFFCWIRWFCYWQHMCVMCRSQIDFNSDLKSSFVKMSDLNLTIRFFPSQWRKTWILSSIKHEDYTFEDGESLKLRGRGFGFMIFSSKVVSPRSRSICTDHISNLHNTFPIDHTFTTRRSPEGSP